MTIGTNDAKSSPESLQPGQLYSEEPAVLERPSPEFIAGLPSVGASDEEIEEIGEPQFARRWGLHSLIARLTRRHDSVPTS